jgi:hypothetical protein
MKLLTKYFYQLKLDKAILWCYLIWYFVIVGFYFDPSPKIWINAVGISAVIGTGLILSVSSQKIGFKDPWQTLRLYLMPFCVSSFSALIKGQGFIVVISPQIQENMVAVFCCAIFVLVVVLIKLINQEKF